MIEGKNQQKFRQYIESEAAEKKSQGKSMTRNEKEKCSEQKRWLQVKNNQKTVQKRHQGKDTNAPSKNKPCLKPQHHYMQILQRCRRDTKAYPDRMPKNRQ